MKVRIALSFSFLILFQLICLSVYAQPTWTFEPFGKQKKPEQFETKKLASEKTEDRRFTFFRRISQNTLTHYNFYYNANNKLNAVLEQSKSSQHEDYSKIISFFPYDLENTSSQKTELDSVIYKSTAAILLHDLRTAWVDNMYLLIGKSYYYRKQFDSAALTFQFINYNLFPRKKKEDDNRIVGANNRAASTKLSIADREKRNFIQKLVTLPPSRNDALIWLARTFIEQELYGESAGLINILQEDPNLPKRLKDDLNVVTAYWYFKQSGYDSAAVYLEKGLSNAANKIDKARWRYLLGQLYEKNGDFDKAAYCYKKAAKGTVDPLMDIYAHLNNAKMLRTDGGKKELVNNISSLLKMAKRDKFETYRDIIFHSAGLLSLQIADTTNAIKYFTKSLLVNENNAGFKSKTHLELGKIAYAQNDYKKAADHYDSLDATNPAIAEDSNQIADRKASLRLVATQINIIELEDSLQMIAALTPIERDAFIKKLVKSLRKSTTSKGDNSVGGDVLTSSFDNLKNNAPVDLFASSSKGGEWYFYNSNMKSRGYSEFKSKWGKRSNVDNWRRLSSVSIGMSINDPKGNADPMVGKDSSASQQQQSGMPIEFSYDALMLNVPVSKEMLDSSNFKVASAMLSLAKLFENDLKDYQQSIKAYEIYLQRFPSRLMNGEIYIGLYHCYLKLENKEKAAYYKNLLDTQFGESRFAKMLNDPQSLEPNKNNPEALKKYETIYDLFVNGSFDSALVLKNIADNSFGNHYWTPQLLFIEAIYHIKCVEDSEALLSLNALVSKYPKTPLADKASTLIDVLSKRKQIENYLDSISITRAEEDEKVIMPNQQNVSLNKPVVIMPVSPKMSGIKTIPKGLDSSIKLPPSMVSGTFKWQSDKEHLVVMLFDNVDVVYINESKNAFSRYNKGNNYTKILINKEVFTPQQTLLLFSVFENATDAVAYCDKIKKAAPTEMSWLQPSKYSFMIISNENLQLLKTNKDLEGYKKLLNNQYPGKY